MRSCEALSSAASARAEIYRILASAFHEPSVEFAEALLSESSLEYFKAVMQDSENHAIREHLENFLSAIPKDRSAEKLQEELLLEYARLFLGPKGTLAPPYESVYFGGLIWGERTQSVLDAYRAAGLKVREDFRQPPDFIATELEFMHYLCTLESNQWLENQSEALKTLELQRGFLEEHLLRWVNPFACSIVKNAGLEFYKAAAKLLANYLQLDFSRIAALKEAAGEIG